MANIIITFTDDAGVANAYQHDLTDAALDRIVTAFRTVFGAVDEVPESPTYGQIIPVNKNSARRQMVRGTVQGWKDVGKRFEQDAAAEAARNAVTDIPSTEV